MKHQKGFIIPILIIIALITFGVIAYLFSLKSVSLNLPTNSPKATVYPTRIPDPTTVNWKIFKDEVFVNNGSVYNAYQVMYPANCIKRDYKILDCNLANSKATIILNAGGHGGGDEEIKLLADNVLKKYSAGEGKFTELELISKNEIIGTFWFNKTDRAEYYSIWGLEFYGISTLDLYEFNILIDKILSTVEFIE